MDRFSFVMVLLSIIVGLGVAELLTNVARQIRNRARVRPYWLHSVLVALVFIALLQQWWESWQQRGVETWTFPILLLMLGAPIGFYIISHLLYPEEIDDVDLRAFYYESASLTYLIAAGTVVFAALYRPLSFGHPLIDPTNVAAVIIFTMLIILAATGRKIVHHTVVPILFAAVLLNLFIFHMNI